ncbi:hypothetical protein A2635_03315 [Candidatus Peribacteria bacterium RIFCSPHIGHO2_01_FULL_51_9]|nr:MAG: hypothetical protein A2635_03315 [Candidatus Peribacteria bacterium RIFCSPHIGHO2_01_FULL_51_9]
MSFGVMTATTPSDQGKKKDPWDGWVQVEGEIENVASAGSPPNDPENLRSHICSGSSWSHRCDWMDATEPLVNSGLYLHEFGVQKWTLQDNLFDLVKVTEMYRQGYRAVLCRTISHFAFVKFMDEEKK